MNDDEPSIKTKMNQFCAFFLSNLRQMSVELTKILVLLPCTEKYARKKSATTQFGREYSSFYMLNYIFNIVNLFHRIFFVRLFIARK